MLDISIVVQIEIAHFSDLRYMHHLHVEPMPHLYEYLFVGIFEPMVPVSHNYFILLSLQNSASAKPVFGRSRPQRILSIP